MNSRGNGRSKIERLSANLENEILGGKFGKPGELFLSTRVLSRKYEISLVSAQRITVELRRKKLIELIGKKFFLTYGVIGSNTVYHKKLVHRRLIGIHLPNLESPYFAALARSVEMVCRKNGYNTVICSSGYSYEEEAEALNLFERLGGSGVLSCPGRNKQLVEVYEKYTLPTVFLSNRISGLENDCVVVDNRSAGEQVAKFLYRKGYRSFLYVSQEILHNGEDERLAGYRAWLEAESIDFSSDDVIYIDNEFDSFMENTIAKAILKKEHPIAVFCNNDLLAMTVLRSCRKWNFVVPQEIGIVGFDDLSVVNDSMHSLTTVHYSTKEIAEEAMKILLRQINGEPYGKSVKKISSYLICRNSTL